MNYFTESEVNLMCEHNLGEYQIKYLRIARMELPCRRKEFGQECGEIMSKSMFCQITNELALKGWINNPRNTSEAMKLTKDGDQIVESLNYNRQKYKRFNYRKGWYNLDLLIQLGQVKAKKMTANSRYYEKVG
jgi:hypothetical protein